MFLYLENMRTSSLRFGLLLAVLLGLSDILKAQVVSIDPPFPSQNDSVTVTYNATLGNGALVGVVPVYAHTGVITTTSTSSTDWQHVQGNWGVADPNVVMTPLGNNLHQISFKINTFYQLSSTDTVTALAFVFRNANGSLVGRNADGSDILIPIYQNSFTAKIFAPSSPQIFLSQSGSLNVSAGANHLADLNLYLNDQLINSATNSDSVQATINLSTLSYGEYWIKIVADSAGLVSKDSTYFIMQGPTVTQDPPAGTKDGINYVNDSTVTLQLYAPYKNYVYAIGDFSNWQFDLQYFMKRNTAGDRYWVTIHNLTPGQKYRFQYSIDQEDMRVADVYSQELLDPWNDQYISSQTYPNLTPYPTGKTNNVVSVFEPGQQPYNWQVPNFNRPNLNKLVVYECLVRDFTAAHDWQTMRDTLGYLKRLGINAIELMPINEFDGNESWGYNPNFYFAPDKYYGPADDLKAFIDKCHQDSIAVILDMVLDHSFGLNPQVRMYFDPTAPNGGEPAANNPWFNQTCPHPYGVGYDYNHESPQTQAFVDSVLHFWDSQFKVDGFRFDLAKGFTNTYSGNNVGLWSQYDQSRINILTRMINHVDTYDPNAYMILEEFADNSEETVLSNNGFMLWGNGNYNYNQASMGYQDGSDLSVLSYHARGWNDPHLMGYAESHDEERLMYKNLTYGNSSGSYNIQDLNTALRRQEAIASFLVLMPGPKMIWQFGELGYDYSINYCPDGTISENCRTSNKPIRWDYETVPARHHLFEVYSALDYLKTHYGTFTTSDFSMDAGGLGKRMFLNNSNMDAVVAANFGVSAFDMVPGFQHAGMWYDYLTGDSLNVTDTQASINFAPGDYHVYTDHRILHPDIITSVKPAPVVGVQKLDISPNPARSSTVISFTTTQSVRATLLIYNVVGKEVRNIFQGNVPAGNHQFRWDGKDNNGNTLPSGLYLITLETPTGNVSNKVIWGK